MKKNSNYKLLANMTLNYIKKGSGKTVVLLHGFMENHKIWFDLAEDLVEKYEVVLIDLPGHGASISKQEVNTMNDMANAVLDTLNTIGVDTFYCIGHSMGGYVALELANQVPDRLLGFCLLNSTTLPDDTEKVALRLKAAELAKKHFSEFVNMSILPLFAPFNQNSMEHEIQMTKEIALSTPIDGVTAALVGMSQRKDHTEVLSDFPHKICIIIGKYDITVNPKILKSIIPERDNIEVYELNCAHMAHLECHEETLAILKAFLN